MLLTAAGMVLQVVWELLFSLLFHLHSTQFCFTEAQDLLLQHSVPGRALRGQVGVWAGDTVGEDGTQSFRLPVDTLFFIRYRLYLLFASILSL